MRFSIILWVFVTALLATTQSKSKSVVKRQTQDEKRTVCYYTYWSRTRKGDARFLTRYIEPFYCTHILYAFAKINDFTLNEIEPFVEDEDIFLGGFKNITNLKNINPDLKVMISLGGWKEGSNTFSNMVDDSNKIKEFVANTIKFLRENSLDGVDIAWQYPSARMGSRKDDRENFVKLVKELKEGFEAEATSTGNSRLILSVVVSPFKTHIDDGFDIPALDRYVDFFNLAAYNYHLASDGFVHHHSPIYPLRDEIDDEINSVLNVNTSVTNLLAYGMTPSKLNLGVPTYGRLYILEDPENTDLGSGAVGQGSAKTTGDEPGFKPYYEICQDFKGGGWTVKYPNRTAMGPYSYNDMLWVCYDDASSARKKGEYARMKGLGGLMYWTIDDDDFLGKCGDGTFPIILEGRSALMGSSIRIIPSNGSRSVAMPAPATQPTPPPTPLQTTKTIIPQVIVPNIPAQPNLPVVPNTPISNTKDIFVPNAGISDLQDAVKPISRNSPLTLLFPNNVIFQDIKVWITHNYFNSDKKSD